MRNVNPTVRGRAMSRAGDLWYNPVREVSMLALLLVPLALADDPCTEDKCAEGEKAKSCKATADDRDDCEDYEAKGWKKVCQSGDDQAWTEVLCKKPEPIKVNASAAERDVHSVDTLLRRCDTTAGGGLGLLTILAAAALARRKR
jgi:hypothetical protein